MIDITNRKFLVVTAVDVNKREVTKVTEVTENRLQEISVVVNQLKKNNKYDSLGENVEIIMNCLPLSYVKLHTIKEIKVLAVIGEISLL